MPTESLHSKIRAAIPFLINMTCDLNQAAQNSAISGLTRLAEHGEQ